MDYEQALRYLHQIARFGSKPGLARIRALLTAMGNPEKQGAYIHVAGTNGKGSTCAFLESILRQAGYKTGLFVSPFVEDFRERARVNGAMLSKEEWSRRIDEMRAVRESVISAGGPPATEFELLTALALRCFAEHGCDVVILEVGLGGRFDATNVIPAPLAAVITSLSFDHVEYLGDTLESIAFEKAGIVKPGCTVVTAYDQAPQALSVLRRRCAEEGAPLVVPEKTGVRIESADIGGTRFTYKDRSWFIPLAGLHQVENAVTAYETILALSDGKFSLTDEAIRLGFQNVHWGGRLEVVCRRPLCLVDGAHNAAKIRALSEAMDTIVKPTRLVTVMGMSSDKDAAVCARIMAARSDVFIATQYEGVRAMPAAALAAFARGAGGGAVEIEPNEQNAVKRALCVCGEGDCLLICGSLYLLGKAKQEIQLLMRG